MMEEKILTQIMQAARGAGEIMRNAHDAENVRHSKEGHANFVTEYDEKVQEYLIRELSRILPEAAFVGEEEGQETFRESYKKGYTFVIDPIDGTSNFMNQYRPSVTSIGLMKDGEPWAGVIYYPYGDDMYSAWKGKGAFKNGRPIHSTEERLSDNLVAFGTSPYYVPEVSHAAFEMAFHYLSRCIDVRRSGACAYDLCMVACGATGLYCEPCVSLWDYAAGACIVQEAGGLVTDLWGKPLSFTGKSSILAVGAGVLKEDYLPPAELLGAVAAMF